MSQPNLNPNDVITYIRQNPTEIFDALKHEHRTHQQATIKSIHQILKSYADHAKIAGCDLRNECAVKFATEVTTKEYYFPFL